MGPSRSGDGRGLKRPLWLLPLLLAPVLMAARAHWADTDDVIAPPLLKIILPPEMAMTRSTPRPEAKILDSDELLDRFGRPRAGRLVFTNGCFDLLHRGHVEYLFSARALGDALVVAVNSDASVRRLKGSGRPLVTLEDRLYVLAGLGCVDAVTAFDEDTPRQLIARLLPDVLTKGGDYRPEDVVGAGEVRDGGGEVIILPFVAGRSTTRILRRMKHRAD